MAILGFGAALDGFAITNARFGEFDFDFVAALQALRDDLQVQFALAGDNGLVQLGIDLVKEGGIFVVQRGQAGGDLVFLTLGVKLERGMNIGSGILHFRQDDRIFGSAERVAGVGVLKLDEGANVARVHGRDAGAVFAVQNIDLAQLFGECGARNCTIPSRT